MSIFSKLNKTDRAKVFSGSEFNGLMLPAGDVQPDSSVICHTREGRNTFVQVSCPGNKATYGAQSVWRCVKPS